MLEVIRSTNKMLEVIVSMMSMTISIVVHMFTLLVKYYPYMWDIISRMIQPPIPFNVHQYEVNVQPLKKR